MQASPLKTSNKNGRFVFVDFFKESLLAKNKISLKQQYLFYTIFKCDFPDNFVFFLCDMDIFQRAFDKLSVIFGSYDLRAAIFKFHWLFFSSIIIREQVIKTNIFFN